MVSTIIIWPHFTNKESEAEVKKLAHSQHFTRVDRFKPRQYHSRVVSVMCSWLWERVK